MAAELGKFRPTLTNRLRRPNQCNVVHRQILKPVDFPLHGNVDDIGGDVFPSLLPISARHRLTLSDVPEHMVLPDLLHASLVPLFIGMLSQFRLRIRNRAARSSYLWLSCASCLHSMLTITYSMGYRCGRCRAPFIEHCSVSRKLLKNAPDGVRRNVGCGDENALT
jgi:hypothetical protein